MIEVSNNETVLSLQCINRQCLEKMEALKKRQEFNERNESWLRIFAELGIQFESVDQVHSVIRDSNEYQTALNQKDIKLVVISCAANVITMSPLQIVFDALDDAQQRQLSSHG